MSQPSSAIITRGRALPLAALAAVLALLIWTAQTDAAEVAPPPGETAPIAISFAPPSGHDAPAIVTCSWNPRTPREVSRTSSGDGGGDWVQYDQHIQRSCTDGVDRSYNRRYWQRDDS